MVFGRPLALLLSAVPLFGGIQLEVREGRAMVDGVYVNGHGPYRFLLDTGTNVNLIEKRLARTIGMNAAFHVDLESATGKTRIGGSDANEIQLGPEKVSGQKFLFSGLEATQSRFPEVRGVLGQWFLSGFDYLIDLRGKRLEFGKHTLSGKRSQIRMRNGRAAVSTSLGDLILDSGADRLVLFGVEPNRADTRYMRTIAGSETVRMVYTTLIIDGRNVWRGDAVALPKSTEFGIAGLMPLSLFKTIYVCNSEGYVVFE